ncbi:MAG: hypothetical protein ACPG32_03535 [Akkermansiaceae bacterium]
MNSTRSLLAVIALSGLATCFAQAQHDHFPNQRWKEVKTDHITIRTQGASSSIAKKYAEKVWDICNRCLPGLKEEYENNTFKTPNGSAASDDKPYRFTIYLVGREYPFKEMVETVSKTMGDRAAGYKQLCEQTKMISDAKHRYVVFCLDGRQGDIDSLLVHSTASAILAGHGRMNSKNDFFHTAGFGYYVEHLIFKKCRVHYLDFSQYYQNVEVVRGAVLDGKSPWTRPVQKLVKKGKATPRLSELFGLEVATLNPERSGLLFALSHFMCHTDENVKKHHAYLTKLRSGSSPSVKLILECYGYADEAAFNNAFKAYIESREFR